MAGPHLKSIDPATGPAKTPTPVVIRGTKLTYVTRATFQGTDATEVTVDKHGDVHCKTPTGTVGTATVVVYDDQGLPSDNSLNYTYV